MNLIISTCKQLPVFFPVAHKQTDTQIGRCRWTHGQINRYSDTCILIDKHTPTHANTNTYTSGSHHLQLIPSHMLTALPLVSQDIKGGQRKSLRPRRGYKASVLNSAILTIGPALIPRSVTRNSESYDSAPVSSHPPLISFPFCILVLPKFNFVYSYTGDFKNFRIRCKHSFPSSE